MAVPIFPANPALTDSNGDIIAGGSVSFYVKNTTTRISLFSDRAGVIPETNPVDIDAAGNLPPVFVAASVEATGIKAVIMDSDGVTIQTIEDIAAAVTGGSSGLFITDFGVEAATTDDQRVAIQSAFDQAATTGVRLDHTGTLLGSTAGAAFAGTFTTAASEAVIKIGTQAIDDTAKLRVGSIDGTGVLKAHVADADATPLVVENINVVDVARGMTFDGNLANGSSGIANAFTFAGVNEVYLPDMVAKNYRTARVCGSRERQSGDVYVGNFRGKNCMGSAALFLGKPFGVKSIRHSGTIEIDGLDGGGRGALTVDNDSTASDADQTPTSVTSSGTTVTVNATAHGFAIGDHIVLSGADQGQYNQLAEVLTVPTADSLTFTANKTPSASPATGTLKLRPNGGPIENVKLDKISARNLTSDSSLFAVKLEDGVEWFDINYVEAIDLREASANSAVGAQRVAPGGADWPMKGGVTHVTRFDGAYFGQDVILGRADYQRLNYPLITGVDGGIGLNVSSQNDIQDHGTVHRLSATIDMSGRWIDSDSRGAAVIINNSDSGEPLVDVLDVDVQSYLNGGGGVCAIKGVNRVNMTIGNVDGGFEFEDSNPNSSGTFVQQTASLAIAAFKSIKIKGGYADLGGRGLSSGKDGSGLELYAANDIELDGGVYCGGTGNNQCSDSALRLSKLETIADQTSACNTVIRGVTFRDFPKGIAIRGADGTFPSGGGYDLILDGVTFDNVADPMPNADEFNSIRTYNCKGLYEGTGAYTGALIGIGMQSTAVTVNIPGVQPGDIAHVSFDAATNGAFVEAYVTANNVTCHLTNHTGAGVTPASGNFIVRVDMVRG